jgi:small subunit ribosomal protein S11
MQQKQPAKRKKQEQIEANGRVYITATFNNTLVTITNSKGNTLYSSSSGANGFKGARKATPFAAITATSAIAKKAATDGLKEVEVFVKGPGSGRDAAVRALKNTGLRIKSIADITPIPHNGPRPRKRRRV